MTFCHLNPVCLLLFSSFPRSGEQPGVCLSGDYFGPFSKGRRHIFCRHHEDRPATQHDLVICIPLPNVLILAALCSGWTRSNKGHIGHPSLLWHPWFQKWCNNNISTDSDMQGTCVSQKSEGGASWGAFFQTCATPAATSTPGKLPEQLKAQSCAEPPWQGLMFQVPLPSGHPPIHNPTNKNTLQAESCSSASVRAGQCPPNSSNAPLGFVSHNLVVNKSLIWALSDVMWA